MSERIFGGVLLLVSLAGIWIGWDLQAPMSYEPVGPRAFPLLVLFLLGLCAIALMLAFLCSASSPSTSKVGSASA